MTSSYVEGSKEWLYGKRVLLYRLATTKKKSYYARFNIPDYHGYVIRSLKTTSYKEAIIEVENLYRNMLHKASLGLSVREATWQQLFEKWYDYHKGIRKKSTTWLKKTTAKNDLFFQPFFGDKDNLPRVALINHTHIQEFWLWRRTYWNDKVGAQGQKIPPPSYRTIQWELILLKNILRYAFNFGYIPSMPRMKHPDMRPARYQLSRAKYTRQDYQRVMDNLKTEMTVRRTTRERRAAQQMRLTVKLIASSGIRVQELRCLRYKHIELRTDDNGNAVTVIVIPNHIAKTKQGRTAICMDGHNCFNMVDAWRRLIQCDDMNQLILQSPTVTNQALDIAQQYRVFIARWEGHDDEAKRLFHRDTNGRPFTLTSWRHSYINMMLSQVEIGVLAEQCGTSIEQISKSYSVEQNWNNRYLLTSTSYKRNVWGLD